MWKPTRSILSSAFRAVRREWLTLAAADLAYKLVAFALITPAVGLLLRWFRSDTSMAVVADADIARFLITTRVGVVTLILGASLIAAITALEVACLMAIGLADAQGTPMTARGALAFGGARAGNVLRLTLQMVLRVLGIVVPFLLVAGGVYLGFLREHDINYYLARKPREFWVALAVLSPFAAAFAVWLLSIVSRWVLALPLVLFEQVGPRRALGESARRSLGSRTILLALLAAWAVLALALTSAAAWLIDALGRAAAPYFVDSPVVLVLFFSALGLFWALATLACGVVNVSLFSMIVLRAYLERGEPRDPRLLVSTVGGRRWRPSGRAAALAAVVLILAAVGAGMLAFQRTRGVRPVLVIAHRGASIEAPENTLAAFRLAADQGADFVELDVQETRDGEVVVVHDADLMKIGNSPLKVWDADFEELRQIDIGSHTGPQFAGERVATLAEALAVCKGRCRVDVELKSYGHDQRLEERVVEIVEAAGMENDCIFMSLDHDMVRKMKRLRPRWRCGLLVAKAMGDVTQLGADFVAVEARMATSRFVRRAHRAGQDVYVWTVDDPAWMMDRMGRGVDGLITNRPALARQVIERRAAMSDAQRFLLALLVRLGARTETLQSESALRP